MFGIEQHLVSHGELDVLPMSAQNCFALVLTRLQQRAHFGRHPAHQMRG